MLNDIDLEALNGAREAIKAEPSAGIATYGVDVTWKTGVCANVSTLPMSLGEEKIPRDFGWTIDEPPQLLGESRGPTPQEFLMSGVGSCIMVGFVVNAAARGVSLESLVVRVTGGLDLAGFLNIREDAPVEMTGLDYEIFVKTNGDTAKLDEIAEAAVNFSPNAMTVSRGVPLSGKLNIL